jgi:hypothetical protein
VLRSVSDFNQSAVTRKLTDVFVDFRYFT